MQDLSYEKHCDLDEAGTCKCCQEVNELKREIEELKSKVACLSLLSAIDSNSNGSSSTEIALVASSDDVSTLSIPITVDKAVLIKCSPVFKAMFENDMEESQSSTIKISDVSYDALRGFVNYLYTEACLEDDEMAHNLLVLAEKYQVKPLKTYCEDFLVKRLNWERAVAEYEFADQYNAERLLDAACLVIINNMDKLLPKNMAFMSRYL